MSSDGDGRFTGTEALKFFAFSNLSRQELKQVLYGFVWEHGRDIDRNYLFVN